MQIEKEENASSRPRRTQALSHRRHSFHSCAGLVYNYFPFYTLLAICDNEPTSGDSLTHSLHRPRSLHVRADSAGGALNDIIINWSVQLDRVTQHGNDECTTLCVQIDETCLDNGKNARVLFFPSPSLLFYQLEITPDAVKRMQALRHAVQSCGENATLESETIPGAIRVAINSRAKEGQGKMGMMGVRDFNRGAKGAKTCAACTHVRFYRL